MKTQLNKEVKFSIRLELNQTEMEYLKRILQNKVVETTKCELGYHREEFESDELRNFRQILLESITRSIG